MQNSSNKHGDSFKNISSVNKYSNELFLEKLFATPFNYKLSDYFEEFSKNSTLGNQRKLGLLVAFWIARMVEDKNISAPFNQHQIVSFIVADIFLSQSAYIDYIFNKEVRNISTTNYKQEIYLMADMLYKNKSKIKELLNEEELKDYDKNVASIGNTYNILVKEMDVLPDNYEVKDKRMLYLFYSIFVMEATGKAPILKNNYLEAWKKILSKKERRFIK